MIKNKVKIPPFSHLIEEQGGFGRHQYIALIIIILCSSSACWVVNAQNYLWLYPKFECEGIIEGTPDYNKFCKPHYFCNNEENESLGNKVVNWSVVEASNISLNNLLVKHDLICASSLTISSFGMAYFAGYSGSSLFLPALSDKKGRKKFLAGAILI